MYLLPSPGAPFVTGSLRYRPRQSAWRLVVLAKQTYTLRPDRCELAARPDPLVAKERARGGTAHGSIQAPSDLVPFKPRPEFVVVGSAFPPPDEPTDELVAAIEVAGVRKALRLRAPAEEHSDRSDTASSNGVRWPLGWEHAVRSEDNPAGVAPGQPPSILPFDEEGGAPGFGPISSLWPSRRRRLGSFESRWSDDSLQWCVLDDRFDGYYFQAAPADQWLDELPAELPLVLEHLHPRHRRLETCLSGPSPRARVRRGRGEPEPITLTADTVVVDSDRAVVHVTWRGQVELGRADEEGVIQFGMGLADQVAWLDEAPDELDDLDTDNTATVRFSDEPGPPVPRPPVPRSPVPRPPVPRPPVPRPRPPLPSSLEVELPSLDLDGATADALPDPRPSEPAWLAPQKEAAGPTLPSPPPGASPLPPPVRPPARSEPPPLPGSHPPPRPSGSSAVRPPNPLGDLYGRRARTGATPPVPEAPAPKGEPRPQQTPEPGLVELVWHSDDAADQVRRDDSLKSLLPPASEPPPPRKPKRGEVPAPPPPPPDPQEETDQSRRDVAIALTEGSLAPLSGLPQRLATALNSDDRRPPLVVVGGSLELSFDDAEALGITCRLAGPVALHDKPLAAAIAMAGDAAEALTDAPALTRPLQARVVKAWRKANRELPADHLEQSVGRALLEKRAYRTIQLLGGRFITGRLPTAEGPLPVYLPEEARLSLPMYGSFKAQLLARVVARQDEAEPHPIALSVLAVGRRLALSGR